MRGGKALWLCLGAVMAHAALITSAAAQPRLKVEPADRTWDLAGEFKEGIRVGQTTEHEFVLKNEGTEPLKITGAKTEGAFLTVVLPEGEIAPGEQGLLKVTLSTEGMEPSLIDTPIVISSNDPASAERPVVLTVKAQVIPQPETLLVVRPQEIDVGVVRPGELKRVPCTVQNAGTEKLQIDPVFFLDDRIKLTGIESEALEPGPAKNFQVEFTARPKDAGQKLDAIFIIKTDSEEQPRVVCHVTGYVAPAEKKPEGVQIVPRFFSSETTSQYFFRIVNNTERAVEVVASRGGEEIKRVVVQPGNITGIQAVVGSEDELKEISFQVNPYYVPPTPPQPTGEAVEPTPGAGAEAETPEGTTPTEPDDETQPKQPADDGT